MNEIEAWIAETREALETGTQLTQMPEQYASIKRTTQRPTGTLQQYGTSNCALMQCAARSYGIKANPTFERGCVYHEEDEGTHQRLARSLGTRRFSRSISYNSHPSTTVSGSHYRGADTGHLFLPRNLGSTSSNLGTPNIPVWR